MAPKKKEKNLKRSNIITSAEFMLRISKYFNLLVEDVFHVED